MPVNNKTNDSGRRKQPTAVTGSTTNEWLPRIEAAVHEFLGRIRLKFDPQESYSGGFPPPVPEGPSEAVATRNAPSLPATQVEHGPAEDATAKPGLSEAWGISIPAPHFDPYAPHTGNRRPKIANAPPGQALFADLGGGAVPHWIYQFCDVSERDAAAAELRRVAGEIPDHHPLKNSVLGLLVAARAARVDSFEVEPDEGVTRVGQRVLRLIGEHRELSGSNSRRRSKEWLPEALGVLRDDPNLTDSGIAKIVDVAPSTISRNAEYQRIAAGIRTANTVERVLGQKFAGNVERSPRSTSSS